MGVLTRHDKWTWSTSPQGPDQNDGGSTKPDSTRFKSSFENSKIDSMEKTLFGFNRLKSRKLVDKELFEKFHLENFDSLFLENRDYFVLKRS